MTINITKTSSNLYALDNEFDLLLKMYNSEKFPKALMLSGKKGIGKCTLVNHFLTYIFDREYDLKLKKINKLSQFYKQYENNIFSNIIYLDGFVLKNVKIDDIRKLKSTILKSNISQMNRFIILDDIELFNDNSLNALLKIIEEPVSKNYYLIINNKSKPVMDTIKSRCLEFRISLNDRDRLKVIESLIKKNNLDPLLDYKTSNITPGNFYLFNNICREKNISIDDDFIINLKTLLDLYKKEKNMNLINLALYIADIHFHRQSVEKKINLEKICETKDYVINNINKFISFNLNPNSLLTSITNKLYNG